MAYGTDQGLIDYLETTGRALPFPATADVARAWGSIYVDQFWDMYKGTALSDDEAFPRDLYPTVPTNVEYAAYEAGYAWATGVSIFGQGGTAGGQVIREKVDVLEVAYASPTGEGWWYDNRYILPLAWVLLMPFFKRKGGLGYAAFVV